MTNFWDVPCTRSGGVRFYDRIGNVAGYSKSSLIASDTANSIAVGPGAVVAGAKVTVQIYPSAYHDFESPNYRTAARRLEYPAVFSGGRDGTVSCCCSNRFGRATA
jgi:hypothetical protein